MIEIISILLMITKIFITFCKFLYPILIASTPIVSAIKSFNFDISAKVFLIGIIYFVISEIIAPLLNI